MDADLLAERIAQFRAAAQDIRRRFDDDRVLLREAVKRLAGDCAARVYASASEPHPEVVAELEAIAELEEAKHVEDGLRSSVESAVRKRFERDQHEVATHLDATWKGVIEDLRGRTEARVNEVRASAATLFNIDLAPIALPDVLQEETHFSFMFLNVGSVNEQFVEAARRLLPRSILRRRMLDRANSLLAHELDKHAGRLRYDVQQRLDGAARSVEQLLKAELDRTIEQILDAVSHAVSRLAETEASAAALDAADADARRVAEVAMQLAPR